MPICNAGPRHCMNMKMHDLRGAALALLLGVALAPHATLAREKSPHGGAPRSDAVTEFLARHWSDPVAPQGKPPGAFSALEASLDPAACGKCHARQFQDWQTSLHSRTMGPGILWQFHVMGQKAANSCMRCHAPLAEQKALIAMQFGWDAAPKTPPPDYVPADLHRRGLVCAACHVRQHTRFGPPRENAAPAAKAPHGGASPSPAFRDSRFCSECHQFPAGGHQVNGKLLENTFEEWRESAAARQGRSCQSCHMPGRRHLWRGIHDAEMTRSALEASLEIRQVRPGQLHAKARLVNVGAGHHFPTYVVPEVVATLRLVDAAGVVRGELARHVIARRINLRLTEEAFDTRLPSGGQVFLEAAIPTPREKGWGVELHVAVHPARHYERVFGDALERPQHLTPPAIGLLRQALAEAEASRYELHRLRRPLPPR
jgi:hypothetical protein